MKKILLFAIGGILSVLLAFRIRQVNHGIILPKIESYEIGEAAELEENFFNYEYEICDGYSVRVNHAELLTYADFLKKHNYVEMGEKPLIPRDSKIFPDMVYDLHVTIRNNNTEANDSGVDLGNYSLYAKDFSLQLETPLYVAVNPQVEGGTIAFQLKPESEMDFNLPFGIPLYSNYAYLSEKIIREKELYLILSLYPVQKQVVIRNQKR